jgi:excisionase family DNA binding protein
VVRRTSTVKRGRDRPGIELKTKARPVDTVFERDTVLLTSMNTPAGSETGLDGHILTVAEVAVFLRVPKSTVYKLATLGEIPARKIGKHWRFLRSDLQERMQRGSNRQ